MTARPGGGACGGGWGAGKAGVDGGECKYGEGEYVEV